MKSKKKAKEASKLRRATNIKVVELLKKIHNQSNYQVKTGDPPPDSPTDSPSIPTIL